MKQNYLDPEDFRSLSDQIQEIKEIVSENLKQKEGGLKDWLDNQDVCQFLNISKRTLQYYRDKNILSFSKIGNKIYYKRVDVEKLLSDNYNGSDL